MNKQLRTWLFGLISALTVFTLTGCGGTWFGEGTVVGKTTFDNAISCGDQELCYPVGRECFYLKVVDKYDQEHEGCVTERVWNDAEIGKTIEITKEYR